MLTKSDRLTKYDRLVDRVIKAANLLLLVLDARNIEESLNQRIARKINRKNKKVIFVINKCDLISEEELKKINLPDSVKISATHHIGTMKLLRKIMEVAHGKNVTVGVVGFPNNGKSTIINALKGKHSAPTSSISGFTKGLQKLRINEKVMMIDTPGVFSYDDIGEAKLASFGAIDADKIKEPELAAMHMIESMNGRIEVYFEVGRKEDVEETLEEIARKKHVLKKGGEPDTIRMAKQIIMLCQKGKIR